MIPSHVAELARDLRQQRRRTRSGSRRLPWQTIADELARLGYGRFSPNTIARAVEALPIETHPEAPPPREYLERLETMWRIGFEADFPGEEWPGLAEAQRRIREKNLKTKTTEVPPCSE